MVLITSKRWANLYHAVILVLVISHGSMDAQETVTIAGTGVAGYGGDGDRGVLAQIDQPFGLVIGPDGDLYFCEVGSHVIRRLNLISGRISTAAGTGRKGYSGNDGPALKADLNEPYEVRFDAEGNMYFVEMMNHVVRRVDERTKTISLVAGSGVAGFDGDGGAATDAQLNRPHSIALDNRQQLYICDIGNHRIRNVDLKTGKIATFAGTGKQGPTVDGATIISVDLNGPRALDFDGKHNLALALREGNTIFEIDLHCGTIHHRAGNGQAGYQGDGEDAKHALLSGPKGVAYATNGDIYFADTESHTIRVYRAGNRIVDTVLGDGKRGDGPDGEARKCELDRPHGVFVDASGRIFVGDSNNHKVRLIRP